MKTRKSERKVLNYNETKFHHVNGCWLVNEWILSRLYLSSNSPCDVDRLELVETSQDTGTSNTTEDVSSSSLHHGHEALVLEDLHSAVNGALVLDSATGGHHHPPSDSINGVGHQTGGDGNSPTKEEGSSNTGILSQKDGLQRVIQTKVHTSVDEDTDGRDDETSVQTLDTVGLHSLDVDVDETIELSLTTLALHVVGQPGTSIVKGVYEEEGHSTSNTTASNVGGKLHVLRSILGGLECSLDPVLEGKVQSLGGEVSQDVSEISSPEGVDTLCLENSGGTVNNTSIGFVQTTLLDHLSLVLHQQLNSLNGSGGGLGHTGGNTREHKVLSKSKLISGHFVLLVNVLL